MIIKKNRNLTYILVKFPTKIMNSNLSINTKHTIESFKIKSCIVSYHIFLSNKEFDNFINNFLSSYNWLNYSNDYLIKYKIIRTEIVFQITNIDTNYSIYVNPQNTSTAKKVGYIYPTQN